LGRFLIQTITPPQRPQRTFLLVSSRVSLCNFCGIAVICHLWQRIEIKLILHYLQISREKYFTD
jgi:hypothetical protein